MADSLSQVLQQQIQSRHPLLGSQVGEVYLLEPVSEHPVADHLEALAELRDQGSIRQFTHVHAHDHDHYLAVL